MVHVRLPVALLKEVDHLAVEEEVFRGEMVTLLLREALAWRKGREEE